MPDMDVTGREVSMMMVLPLTPSVLPRVSLDLYLMYEVPTVLICTVPE